MKTRKVVTVILALILAFSLALPAAATNEVASDDVKYADDTVAVIKYSDSEIYEYTSLQAAIDDSATGDTINLVKNYTIPNSISIPADVTVIVPTSDALDDTNTGSANVDGAGSATSVNITLTVPKGLTLSVETGGTLLVAGNQQSSVPKTGFLTGPYGAINLEGNLEVYGDLYARGEISGSGTVTAHKGGNIYQRFEISDWRGGTASQAAYDIDVFPFNLYTLSGITSKEVYESGASLHGQSLIFATVFGSRWELQVSVPYIGPSTGDTYLATTSDKGSIQITEENGVSTLTVSGTEIETGDLEFTYSFTSISSRGLIAPFGYKTNIVIDNGGVVNLNSKIKLLPESKLDVEDGTLNIASSGGVYVYGADKYSTSYYNGTYGTLDPSVPATLTVSENGHVTLASGGVLASTSANHSNIVGLNLTEDGTADVVEVTQSGTSVTPHTITFDKYLIV